MSRTEPGAGINATINVTANITPNITIRIEPPSRSAPSTAEATRPQQSVNVPGLSPEILQEIRNSVDRCVCSYILEVYKLQINNKFITNVVKRMSEHNDPVVIRSESQPERDVGRIVGEAVSATIQQLNNQQFSNQQQSTSQRQLVYYRQ